MNRVDPSGHADQCPDCSGGGDLLDEERLERLRAARSNQVHSLRSSTPDFTDLQQTYRMQQVNQCILGDAICNGLVSSYDLFPPLERVEIIMWSIGRGLSGNQQSWADALTVVGQNIEDGLLMLAMGGDLQLVVGSGNFYSVAYEATLPQSVYEYSRSSHYYRANKALLADMSADPQFALGMNDLIPDLSQQLYYRPYVSPKGWTWHHVADRPGVMQLIPRIQQESPLLQSLLHPGRSGGYSLWGS